MSDLDEHWERTKRLRAEEFRTGASKQFPTAPPKPKTIEELHIQSLIAEKEACEKKIQDAQSRFPAKNQPSAKVKLSGNPEVDWVLEQEQERALRAKAKAESDAQRERLLWQANHSTAPESANLATPSAAAANSRENARQQALREALKHDQSDLDKF